MPPSRQREREMERLRRLRQAQRRAEARRRERRRNAVIGSVVAVLIVIGAVGLLIANLRGGKAKPTAVATPPAAATPSSTAAPFPPLPAGADPRLGVKPVPAVPKTAPKKLESTDVLLGKGATARNGTSVTVNYVGVGFPAGKEFDSSWNRKAPFTFVLGKGDVIKGWDQGLLGMKVGGRRQLVIPSALAYGPKGSPPTIKGNEPLVFVVDLLAAK